MSDEGRARPRLVPPRNPYDRRDRPDRHDRLDFAVARNFEPALTMVELDAILTAAFDRGRRSGHADAANERILSCKHAWEQGRAAGYEQGTLVTVADLRDALDEEIRSARASFHAEAAKMPSGEMAGALEFVLRRLEELRRGWGQVRS